MTTQQMYDKAQSSARCETFRIGKYEAAFLPFRNTLIGTEHCLIDIYRASGMADVLIGTLIVAYPFRSGEPVNGYGICGTGRTIATLQEAIDAIETTFYGALSNDKD